MKMPPLMRCCGKIPKSVASRRCFGEAVIQPITVLEVFRIVERVLFSHEAVLVIR